MDNKLIEVNKLWTGPSWREYSKQAELIVGGCLQRHFGTKLIHLTEGYAPEYDMLMSDGKYESKITRGEEILIEFARADGTPSGISISKSDFYVITHQGYGTWPTSTAYQGYGTQRAGTMQKVGKVRRIPTSTLKQVALSIAERNEHLIVVHEASVHGPGSMCVKLSASKNRNDFRSCGVDDGWVVDVLTDVRDGSVVYDFGQEGNKNRKLGR